MKKILVSEVKAKFKITKELDIWYLVNGKYIKVWGITPDKDKKLFKLQTYVEDFSDFISSAMKWALSAKNNTHIYNTLSNSNSSCWNFDHSNNLINDQNQNLYSSNYINPNIPSYYEKIIMDLGCNGYIVGPIKDIWFIINFSKNTYIDEEEITIFPGMEFFSETYEEVRNKKKSLKEMQEEFLKNKGATVCESIDINRCSKDLDIYKSKMYINKNMDHKEAVKTLIHVYDNTRFMTPDGSVDILFTFKRMVFESRGTHFQTIYWCNQINNKNFKEKRNAINEINIPEFLEKNNFVLYDHKICSDYHSKYGQLKNKYTIDEKFFDEDFD